MASAIVQSCAANATQTVNAGTTLTQAGTLPSSVAASGAILVLLGADADNIDFITGTSVADSQSNAYTPVFAMGHSSDVGPALAAYFCASAGGGENTVTGSFTTDWSGFGAHSASWFTSIIVIEFPPGYTVQSHDNKQEFGNSNPSSTLTLNDSSTVGLSWTTSAPINATGAIDIFGDGEDWLYACAINVPESGVSVGTDAFTSSPSGYDPASLVVSTPSSGTNAEYLALYQCGSGPAAIVRFLQSFVVT